MIAITTDTSWQLRSVCNELLQYHNAVALFLGLSQFGTESEISFKREVTSNDVVCDFILKLQARLISPQYCARAVKPSATFEGLAAGVDYPKAYGEYSDLSQLYQDAGIDGGFRRCTVTPADWTNRQDPAYSYGIAQPGDLIGPWLFKDLQDLVKHIKVFKFNDVIVMPHYGPYACQRVVVDYINYTLADDNSEDYPPSSELVYENLTGSTHLQNLAIAEHSGIWQPAGGGSQSSLFRWFLTHQRFHIAIPYVSSEGDGVYNKADFFGRVVNSNSNYSFWPYPHGLESAVTKKIAPTLTADYRRPVSALIGNDQLTSVTQVWEKRPAKDEYLTGLEKYRVDLTDVVIRVELDWTKL